MVRGGRSCGVWSSSDARGGARERHCRAVYARVAVAASGGARSRVSRGCGERERRAVRVAIRVQH